MLPTRPFALLMGALLCALLHSSISTAQDEPPPTLEERVAELERLLEAQDRQPADRPSSLSRFSLGGYGEIHANLGEGSSDDQIDIHRFVFMLGYEFADWLQLTSETEIEHAFISDDDGEISIEQLYLDANITDSITLRAGRVLIPVGILNLKHEPISFNGVERSLFDQVIVPSTWFSDGIGAHGRVAPELHYQMYVVAGLDGSEFDGTDGIRGGRLKERPSLNEPAVTARLDVYPFARKASTHAQELRLGLSGYAGGIDNGDQGEDPGLDGSLVLGAIDFEYSIGAFDFRGAAAIEEISGAEDIGNGSADRILGFSFEAAIHALPTSWKKGRLERADLVLFARYDDVDTQAEIDATITPDDRAHRQHFTTGATFFLTPFVVLKADVVFRNDDATGDLPALVNFGIGWSF